jgi:hypothetical protein
LGMDVRTNGTGDTMKLLLLTLIAHTLTDFIFQTDWIIVRKEQLKATGFWAHGAIIFILSLLLLLGCQPLQLILYSLTITLVHLGIDYLKAVVLRKNDKNGTDFIVFLVDQALHFLTILLVWQWFDLSFDPRLAGFYGKLIGPKLLAVLAPENKPPLPTSESLLLWVLTFLWVGWGGAILIRKFLNYIADKNGSLVLSGPIQNHTIQRTGNYIGILERMLILTFVLNNSLTAVAFIFTAKSIARFNELNNREFAEYYLVGTLSSTALAICGGLIASFLNKML